MKYLFVYYMHDEIPDTMEDRAELADCMVRWAAEDLPPPGQGETSLSLEIAARILEDKPFYEVKLTCSYDDETGKVTIISAEAAE